MQFMPGMGLISICRSMQRSPLQYKPLIFESVNFVPMVTSVRGLKVKKDAAKGGGKKGAAMVKPVLEVEEDAHKEIHSNFPKNNISKHSLCFPFILSRCFDFFNQTWQQIIN